MRERSGRAADTNLKVIKDRCSLNTDLDGNSWLTDREEMTEDDSLEAPNLRVWGKGETRKRAKME